MRPILLFVCLVLAAGLTIACGGGGGTKELAVSDAGTTVKIKNGDTFRVTLDGNPTTGYAWEPENLDTAILAQQGDWEFKPDSSAVGAGGAVTTTFKAVGPGTTTLRLIYHRPFEQGVAPVKTWEVTIQVE